MSFPLSLLVAWESWQDSKRLFRAIEDVIVLGTPANTIDWLITIDDLRSEGTSS